MLSGAAQCEIQTPLGTLQAVVNDVALQALYFKDQKNAEKLAIKNSAQKVAIKDHPVLLQLEEDLQAYFLGELKGFTVPIAPQGTEFQKTCWQALRRIPYAAVHSYGQQAKVIGNEKAVRAVASANANNPIIIVIPCHRVIAQNGNLSGFAAGVDRKAALIELEKMS